MAYFDVFLVPVPTANKDAYLVLAKISTEVLMEYGAVRVVELWKDTAGAKPEEYHAVEAGTYHAPDLPTFERVTGANADESVVLSWVEWTDKNTRDQGMDKVMADPRMQFTNEPPTFEGKRLIAGGFEPLITTDQS